MVYIIGIILVILLLVASFYAGLYIQSLKDVNKQLADQIIEIDAEDDTALIDISPKALDQRKHDAKRVEPEDSAVLHIKTRKQLDEAKEREINALVGQYK